MRWIAYVVLAGCWTGSVPPPEPIASTPPPTGLCGRHCATATPESAPALSALSDERARQLFASGERNYNLGAYREAAQDFEAAYDEVPNYVLLYNVAQAYRQAGDRPQALANYQRFLDEGGTQITQTTRDMVTDQIQKLSAP